MARPGLFKKIQGVAAQVTLDLLSRVQDNITDAVNTLTADDDILRAPAFTMVVSGEIPPAKSVVLFRGAAGQELTLPLSNGQGDNVAALVVVANLSANAVTIRSAGSDTVNGGTSMSLLAGAVAIFTSDGAGATSG